MYTSDKNKRLSLDITPGDGRHMSQMNLKKLSESLQISPSTVSKALNNCFGVDAATRCRILDAAAEAGYVPAGRKAAQGDILCILPDSPSYFWRPLFEGLRAAGRPCRFRVLSTLSDEALAREYLRLAAQDGARVLIVSLPMTAEIRTLLETYAQDALVILLTQFGDVKNTVYVGEDAFQTGRALGEAYAAHLSRFRRIVRLEASAACISARRSEGFFQTATAGGAQLVGTIAQPEPGPAMASCLARELHDRFGEEFDCVYCNNGVLYHVALALEKLKLIGRAVCVGYEYEKRNQKYVDNGAIAAWAVQDPYTQGRQAMAIAAHYLDTASFPDSKCVYIPSTVQINPCYP